jgi:hypothetical protein
LRCRKSPNKTYNSNTSPLKGAVLFFGAVFYLVSKEKYDKKDSFSVEILQGEKTNVFHPPMAQAEEKK